MRSSPRPDSKARSIGGCANVTHATRAPSNRSRCSDTSTRCSRQGSQARWRRKISTVALPRKPCMLVPDPSDRSSSRSGARSPTLTVTARAAPVRC
jgi:hypothetical protein